MIVDDIPVIDLCSCVKFKYWYTTDNDIEVCHCGHPTMEHLDQSKSCIGRVIIDKGVR